MTHLPSILFNVADSSEIIVESVIDLRVKQHPVCHILSHIYPFLLFNYMERPNQSIGRAVAKNEFTINHNRVRHNIGPFHFILKPGIARGFTPFKQTETPENDGRGGTNGGNPPFVRRYLAPEESLQRGTFIEIHGTRHPSGENKPFR